MQSRAKWVVIFALLAASFFLIGRSCKNTKRSIAEETRVTFYVDSAWSKGPGEINTLQNDVIYVGRTTDGEVHTSKSRISVGDSFVYVYTRVY